MTRAAASSSARPLGSGPEASSVGTTGSGVTHRPAPPTRVLEDRAGGTQLRAAGKPGPEPSSASHRELNDIGGGLGA